MKLETLNIVTGAMLTASGLANLLERKLEAGMGWIIFGAMYLVMDDYSQARATGRTKIVFGWVGFIASALLFLYYLFHMFV